jgi:hypothetical protein
MIGYDLSQLYFLEFSELLDHRNKRLLIRVHKQILGWGLKSRAQGERPSASFYGPALLRVDIWHVHVHDVLGLYLAYDGPVD